jgi:hypothetical protein
LVLLRSVVYDYVTKEGCGVFYCVRIVYILLIKVVNTEPIIP